MPSYTIAIRWIEEDGSAVMAGQTVLELDNSTFIQQLQQSRLQETQRGNELERKRADTAVQLADLEFAFMTARVALAKANREAELPVELQRRREYREKQLALARARVAAEKAEEEWIATGESSEAEIEVLAIQVEIARREITAATNAIEALEIKAPADGILVVEEERREARKFQVGDTVRRGQTVLRIPGLDRMMVRAWLSDVDDGTIVPGLPVLCTLDAFPDTVYEGVISAISPIAVPMRWQSDRRAFKVTIPLDRANPEVMRPGMSVRAEVILPPLDDVWLAPRRTLEIPEKDNGSLQLASGDTVSVAVLACNNDLCAVEGEGLVEGLRLASRSVE